MPLAHPWHSESRTWKLLAPLGNTPEIWIDCLFMNPVADIAVLGVPTVDELSHGYDKFINSLPYVRPGALPPSSLSRELPVLVLSLSGKALRSRACVLSNDGLWLRSATQMVVGGMSGSPILALNGIAIGVISTAREKVDEDGFDGPMPRLDANLPGWLLREMRLRHVPLPTE